MRIVKDPQMQLGEVDISQIKFDPKSRDEMPQVLRGLQYIYTNLELRTQVFDILEKHIYADKKNITGRPGMDLWKILVLGVVRLNLNWNYDRLQNEANHHAQIRAMLGHSDDFEKPEYKLQTLKDNVSLLTPELLDEINVLVVHAGHKLVKKKDDEPLRARCDSFVLETNVHYPTDINLLFDAMRKMIQLTARHCAKQRLSDLRQSKHAMGQLKNLMRSAQVKKRSCSKNEATTLKLQSAVIQAHQAYIDMASVYVEKTTLALAKLKILGVVDPTIEEFMVHAKRQMDQIERRVMKREVIPHEEKVFSLFEPHTEWIMKGKAGVSVELGLKVCVLEDQHQFILMTRIMENETDDQAAVPMVEKAQHHFPNLNSVSYDKGFHSKKNQEILSEKLDFLVMPRKGKLSEAAKEIEHAPEFIKARHQHSGVESAINALECHGLDVCPDKGLDAFKRYVSLAAMARNLQRIGAILSMQVCKKEKRAHEKFMRQKELFRCVA